VLSVQRQETAPHPFAGPIRKEWFDQLRDSGVAVVTYVPENSYLVYGDAGSLGRLQTFALTSGHVQWDGAYPGNYKVHPGARALDGNGTPRDIGTENFAIQLVADAEANPPTLNLLSQLARKPIKRQKTFMQYVNVVVSLEPGISIVAAADVISIQPYYERVKFDERQDRSSPETFETCREPWLLGWLGAKGFKPSQFQSSRLISRTADIMARL
jgi:hypothetical protein